MALDLGGGLENGNVYATLMPAAAIKSRGRELVCDESFGIGPGTMNSLAVPPQVLGRVRVRHKLPDLPEI